MTLRVAIGGRILFTLNRPEAARKLGIGLNSAYKAASNKELPTIKIGDRLLVPRAALEALLKVGAA